MYRDTDGYIIIDLKGIDVSRASQSVPGLYEKIEPVLDANKLVIVNNAGNHTPLPGSCIKSSNYIRITTDIYIFTINSNNILIIEANGSSITVDVSIIPAYSEGTKIADFEINGQSGELYIPAYPDIINDSVASDHTVYSSDKVNTLLSGKADTSAIPNKTSQLDNDSGFITSSDIPAIPDDLNDLSDVDISSASDAQVLTYDAISGKWVNATSPSGVTELSQLSDVTIASASDGNVLTYDSTSGKWVNEAIPSGVTTLDGLSDVSLTTPASGNALVFDGTEWVNDTLEAADIPYSSGVSVADELTKKMNHIKDMSAAPSGHPVSTDLLPVSDGTNEYNASISDVVSSAINYQNSDPSNVNVSFGVFTELASLILNKGTYIISGSHEWTTGFTEGYIDELNGIKVRNLSGAAGGGFCFTIIAVVANNNTTVQYRTYLNGSTNRVANAIHLQAVKIK